MIDQFCEKRSNDKCHGANHQDDFLASRYCGQRPARFSFGLGNGPIDKFVVCPTQLTAHTIKLHQSTPDAMDAMRPTPYKQPSTIAVIVVAVIVLAVASRG